jgi:transcription elongation factor GreA
LSATEDVSAGNPLLDAAGLRGIDGFEAAWLELLATPPTADVFLDSLEALDLNENREVSLPLLTLLLESCREREQHGEVLDVSRRLLPLRPRKLDLMAIAKESVAGLLKGQDHADLFLELAGFDGSDLEATLERLERMRGLLPDSPVYHGTGWGEGVVTKADFVEGTIDVRFRSDGRERSMPFTTGLDVLRPLPADDLRARIMVDAEGLATEMKEDPAVLIRAVARLSKGRCTAKECKQWLAGAVVPESSWASWWKKAKAAAANDAWLIVENPARPTFIVRRRALSPAEAVGDALNRANTLPATLEVVRGPLALEPEDSVRERLLDGLVNALERGDGTAHERVESYLLLSRHGRYDLAEAGRRVGDVLDNGVSFGRLTSGLSPAALRKDALDALVAARPDLWSDVVIGDLPSLPATLLDAVAERLMEAGRGNALANRLRIFLLTPSRQPETVVRLARRWALGGMEGMEDAPRLTDVLTGLLHLAETHAPKADRGDKTSKPIMKVLVDLLSHKKADLFGRFGREAARHEMERAMGVVARCRSMPREISEPLEEACHVRFPDLVPRDETPFWEGNAILCSNAGLARRQDEYSVLLNEKIPENSEAIGKAAAFGDLSENYEWTAAIEQQRQLTEKAAAMEAELKLARAIEDEELPPDTVAPGTRVTFTQEGEQRVITILGPWDVGDDVVSYRAPMASGMLGAHPGDEAVLALPAGDVTVSIVSVEAAV